MAKVNLYHEHDDKWWNKTISGIPGVKASVQAEAAAIGARAEGLLAAHRREGGVQVDVEYGVGKRNTDALVHLTDTQPGGNVVAVEYGWTTQNGRMVPGLHILSRASGMV